MATTARYQRDPGLYLGNRFFSLYIGPHVHKKSGSWGWGIVAFRYTS